MKVLCVIPARYASTRLPGKPLKDIAGKPMVCRVYERAAKAKNVAKTIVATDDERILAAVQKNGGEAMMTRKDHATGTDRLAEVAASFPDVDLIVNVQGDEPLIEPSLIDALIAAFADDSELNMATVKTQITDEAEANNPNNVKVVTDKMAMHFIFRARLCLIQGILAVQFTSISGYMRTSVIFCLNMLRWSQLRWKQRSH